jgi:hypothetical protein
MGLSVDGPTSLAGSPRLLFSVTAFGLSMAILTFQDCCPCVVEGIMPQKLSFVKQRCRKSFPLSSSGAAKAFLCQAAVPQKLSFVKQQCRKSFSLSSTKEQKEPWTMRHGSC